MAVFRDEGVNDFGDATGGPDRVLRRKAMRPGGRLGERGRPLKATRETHVANVRSDGYKPRRPAFNRSVGLGSLRPKNRPCRLVMQGSATLRRSARGSHGPHELAGSGPPLGKDLERRGKRHINWMHAIPWQDV